MAARSEQEPFLDGVLGATIDTVLAFGSVWLFLTTVVLRTSRLVGSPVAESTLQLTIGLVAFGTIYPFVTRLWPLRRWLRFLAIAAISFFPVSFVTFYVLVPITGISAASELLQSGILATSLIGAAAVSVLIDR